MEEVNIENDNEWRKLEKAHRRGKVMGGVLVVAIGSLYLARELGVELPFWLFSWKMLLIGLGVVAAVKHKFLHAGWIALVGVGTLFLLNDLYPEMNMRPLLWPIVIIFMGLFIIFKPRRRYPMHMHRHWQNWRQHKHGHWHGYQDMGGQPSEASNDDRIDCTSFMAGVKKNIISKKFKGGEITNVFGSTELNLSQADIDEKATLDITQVFGGTKLILPANWEIRSELVTVFGSVEDKRPSQQTPGNDSSKLLVLSGTTLFGGIEIRSF